MNVTEAAARQLMCPLHQDLFCQAAGCMAWRWAKGHEVADKDRKGYCGLVAPVAQFHPLEEVP